MSLVLTEDRKRVMKARKHETLGSRFRIMRTDLTDYPQVSMYKRAKINWFVDTHSFSICELLIDMLRVWCIL